MTLPRFEPARMHVFRYPITRAGDDSARPEQRDIFVGRDDGGQVRIWGELADQGPTTKIELCRVFLEYAGYCASAYSDADASRQMGFFGERIGRRLAQYLRRNPSLMPAKSAALGALECLFGTIRAPFFEDYAAAGVRFVVTDCPLDEAAKRLGLPEVELARHAINAMCQSLCQGMNPQVVVKTLPDNRTEFMITITEKMGA